MIKSIRIGCTGPVARIEEVRNAYSILVGKPEEPITLKRSGFKFDDNIKVNVKEIGFCVVYWIELAQLR
jgi:hypothetical protein